MRNEMPDHIGSMGDPAFEYTGQELKEFVLGNTGAV